MCKEARGCAEKILQQDKYGGEDNGLSLSRSPPPVFKDGAIMSLHVSHGSAGTPRAAVVTYISSVVNVHFIHGGFATSKASVVQDVIIKKVDTVWLRSLPV